MKPDLEELRRLAEAATPGPYDARLVRGIPADCVDYGVISLVTGQETCRTWTEDDARFYAAANPQTVLYLLDRIKELEADNERMREALEQRDNDLSLVLDCFEFYRDAAGESMDPEDSETIQQINSDLILRQLDVARADRARALLEGE